jgi:hypothetical protein
MILIGCWHVKKCVRVVLEEAEMTTERFFLPGCEKEDLLTSFPMKHILSNSSSCPTIEIVSFKPVFLFANIRVVILLQLLQQILSILAFEPLKPGNLSQH